MTVYNTTVAANLIPEVWSARFYEVLRVTLPFIDCVTTDWQQEIKALGDTVNISEIEDFDEATELAEGAQGTTDSEAINNIQLLINKRTYKDFKITNRAELQALPFVDKLREKAVFSINKRVQQLIIDNIVPSASTPDHQIAYDSGSTLALADILEAKELLDDENVADEDRFMTLGSAQWNDLYNITGLTSRDFIPSGSPLASGQFNNDILGFMPKKTTAAGAVAYFHHKSFMTMAMQQELNIQEFDLGVTGERGVRINCDILWGLKQMSNVRVVTIS